MVTLLDQNGMCQHEYYTISTGLVSNLLKCVDLCSDHVAYGWSGTTWMEWMDGVVALGCRLEIDFHSVSALSISPYVCLYVGSVWLSFKRVKYMMYYCNTDYRQNGSANSVCEREIL